MNRLSHEEWLPLRDSIPDNLRPQIGQLLQVVDISTQTEGTENPQLTYIWLQYVVERPFGRGEGVIPMQLRTEVTVTRAEIRQLRVRNRVRRRARRADTRNPVEDADCRGLRLRALGEQSLQISARTLIDSNWCYMRSHAGREDCTHHGGRAPLCRLPVG